MSRCAQPIHTNSLDETWALPTEEAMTVAPRMQQILGARVGGRPRRRSARQELLRRVEISDVFRKVHGVYRDTGLP